MKHFIITFLLLLNFAYIDFASAREIEIVDWENTGYTNYLDYVNALSYATMKGDLEKMEKTLKTQEGRDTINSYNHHHSCSTPLHYAAFNNDTQALKLLFKYGAKVYVKADDHSIDSTPLICLVETGINQENTRENIKLLLENGDDIKARECQTDFDGFTAFMFAVYNAHIEAMEALIECGYSNCDDYDSYLGYSSSIIAFLRSKEDEYKELTSARKKAKIKNEEIKTKSSYANRDVLKILIAHDFVDIHAFFSNEGASSRAQNTLLMYMAQYGAVDIIQFLIENGVDINAKNKGEPYEDGDDYRSQFEVFGKTALHFAVSHGETKAVELLVKNGVDVNAKDNAGKTALDYAKAIKEEFGIGDDMLALLLKHGAKSFQTR